MRPKDPRLGRIYRYDPANALFPAREAIGPHDKPINKSWTLPRPQYLDQGQTPECVGFSAAHDLAAEPGRVSHVTADLAHQIYLEARRDDEWPGEDYEGSSVLGGSRALSKLGYTGVYRWAGEGGSDAADDVALSLSYVGPVVLGTDFLDDMFDLVDGVFVVSGAVAGGHAYLARWIAVTKSMKERHLGTDRGIRDEPLIGGPNSWGLSWGNRGEWAMWLSDLRKLLKGIDSPGEARVSSTPFRRSHP